MDSVVSDKKIKAIYYLNYPDGFLPDPEDAASEIRVEVGDEDSGFDFDHCYSIEVVTIRHLSRTLQEHGHHFLPVRSILIVSRFEDALILDAIEGILEDIESYGTMIE
jgi:hypothetical protein